MRSNKKESWKAQKKTDLPLDQMPIYLDYMRKAIVDYDEIARKGEVSRRERLSRLNEPPKTDRSLNDSQTNMSKDKWKKARSRTNAVFSLVGRKNKNRSEEGRSIMSSSFKDANSSMMRNDDIAGRQKAKSSRSTLISN